MIRKQFNEQNLPAQTFKFEDSLTVQHDVPTLVEILSRYAQTGEIIGTARPIYSEETIDCDVIQPDVEDLNISYQNIYRANGEAIVLKETVASQRQHNEAVGGGVEKPTEVNESPKTSSVE